MGAGRLGRAAGLAWLEAAVEPPRPAECVTFGLRALGRVSGLRACAMDEREHERAPTLIAHGARLGAAAVEQGEALRALERRNGTMTVRRVARWQGLGAGGEDGRRGGVP